MVHPKVHVLWQHPFEQIFYGHPPLHGLWYIHLCGILVRCFIQCTTLKAPRCYIQRDYLSKKAANWGSIWNNSSLVAGAAWESRPYRLSWHFQSPRHRGTAHQNRSWVRWQNTHRCWSWSSCPHSPNPISCTIYVVVIIKRRSALSKYVENFYLRMLWNWITIPVGICICKAGI